MTLLKDVRYAIRVLRKKPGFVLASVITLALGIGGSTAIFSVVNAVILRQLPFPDQDRLVRIWESNLQRGWPTFSASGPNFLDWKNQNEVFERIAAQDFSSFTITGDGEPERITGANVSSDLFPILGVTPAAGRNFIPEDEQPGRDKVAIITNGFWQRRLGGTSDPIGSTLQLNGESYTIVGVLP